MHHAQRQRQICWQSVSLCINCADGLQHDLLSHSGLKMLEECHNVRLEVDNWGMESRADYGGHRHTKAFTAATTHEEGAGALFCFQSSSNAAH